MEQLVLLEPKIEYADDIWEFRREILECDADTEDRFAGCMSLDVCKSAEEWIKICTLRKSEETCETVGSTVPSHMYLAVRIDDNKIIGIIDLRHHISSYSWDVGRSLRIFCTPFGTRQRIRKRNAD